MIADELMEKWGRQVRITKDICWTWTEDYVLAFLIEEASKSKAIIETGCYMGASAYAMLLACWESHLWTIDKFDVPGTEHVTRRNLKFWIDAGRCELIIGDSERGAKMLGHMTGKVDLIFIDDGHAEEDLLRDIRCMKPLLKPGGVMLGHDFDVPHNDVARGVIRSGIKFDVPVPRLWRYIQP